MFFLLHSSLYFLSKPARARDECVYGELPFLCETRDAWRCGAEMAFFYGVGFRVLRGHITFFFLRFKGEGGWLRVDWWWWLYLGGLPSL